MNIMDDDEGAEVSHAQSQEETVVVVADPAQPHLTEPSDANVNQGQANIIPPPPVTGSVGAEASPGMSNTSWNFESIWGDFFLSEEAQVPHTHDDPSAAVPRAQVETHCDAPAATLPHLQGFSDFLDL